jgi:hypothetical protein
LGLARDEGAPKITDAELITLAVAQVLVRRFAARRMYVPRSVLPEIPISGSPAGAGQPDD